jgi:hypothetical protein
MIRGIPAVTDKTILAEVGTAVGPHISAVARELRSWRFLHLGMAALRESSERAASARLASDGPGRARAGAQVGSGHDHER